MANFNKRPGGEGKKPFRAGGNRKRKPGTAAETDNKSKRSEYKAKRSFTRNKDFRSKQDEAPGEKKPYRGFERKVGGDRPFKPKFERGERPAFSDKPDGKKDGDFKSKSRPESGFNKDAGDRPRRKFESGDKSKPFNKRSDERPVRKFGDRDKEKPFKKRGEGPAFERRGERKESDGRSGFKSRGEERERRVDYGDFEEGKVFGRGAKKQGDFDKPKAKKRGPAPVAKQPSGDGLVRLNKYLSNAGIASRREADTLILSGAVKVNGVVVSQMGYKIKPGDKVTYGDEAVKSERKIYLLLNKPKDYITTTDDPRERKTVMELIEGACRERVYPVGRLDRNTTGLLLFTNDGELTTRLTHPKFGIKKVYHVSLDKGLKPDDFKAIIEGVELEDGMVKADDLAFVGEGKKEVGIEIHSGRNRIVRRLFEHLGYEVIKLDRVVFAGLTKKDLPRGKYRFLNPKEVNFLHMLS